MNSTDRPREVCYRCFKPRELCLCAQIPRVQNRTGIYVLQHAHERMHVVGTVRIARLGLAKIDVTVQGPNEREPSPLSERLPAGTGFLYPGEGARDLASLSVEERPGNLLLIDGTWTQAQDLYRLNPWLAGLPCFRLTPAQPSQYRIRREPSPEYVSTIEAIVGALRILEPETEGLDGLLAAFTTMIDEQEARGSVQVGRYRRLRPPRRPRAIPQALSATPERVVVVRAEFSQQAEPGAGRSYELVHLVARRLLEAERFEALVRPERLALSEERIGHIGLTRADFEQGETTAAAVERWHHFARPGDVFAFWNQGERDAFVAAVGVDPESAIVLRAAYCNTRRRRSGTLAEVLAHEQLDWQPEPFRGRAGGPLGQLHAVVRLLRSLDADDAARQEPGS